MGSLTLVLNDDLEWMRTVAMPALGIHEVEVREDTQTTKRYPDCWFDPSANTVTFTTEWARQSQDERRKRALHELMHKVGLEHDDGLGYRTKPSEDTFSSVLYHLLKTGKVEWFKEEMTRAVARQKNRGGERG